MNRSRCEHFRINLFHVRDSAQCFWNTWHSANWLTLWKPIAVSHQTYNSTVQANRLVWISPQILTFQQFDKTRTTTIIVQMIYLAIKWCNFPSANGQTTWRCRVLILKILRGPAYCWLLRSREGWGRASWDCMENLMETSWKNIEQMVDCGLMFHQP